MKKTTKQNMIFAAAILLLAAALWGWRSWNTGRRAGATLYGQVTYGDSNTVVRIPLDENRDYQWDTGYYTIHIRVEDGTAAFVDSPCPDHICESYGRLSLPDQFAVCMPAHAMLEIIAPE